MHNRTTLVAGSGNPLWLTGFLDVVYGLDTIDVVGIASDPPSLLKLVNVHKPDMVIVEVAMIEEARRLFDRHSVMPRILIVGPNAHAGTRPSFGRDFCCGYVSERRARSGIAESVSAVARCHEPRAGRTACGSCPVPLSFHPPALPLSPRENEIFVLLGWGKGPSEIGTELGIRVKTVETHCESLKRKLALSSTLALREAALAWRDGELLSMIGNGRLTAGRP